jgi:hypothetical protein
MTKRQRNISPQNLTSEQQADTVYKIVDVIGK